MNLPMYEALGDELWNGDSFKLSQSLKSIQARISPLQSGSRALTYLVLRNQEMSEKRSRLPELLPGWGLMAYNRPLEHLKNSPLTDKGLISP